MTDQTENVQQTEGVGRTASGFWSAFLACMSRRWFHWVLLALICGLAFAYRCLHLLKPDHYYIISPDSYFFHFMADLVASGDKYRYPTQFNTVLPYWLHSGLTYPVGLPARAFAFVSGVAPHDAVAFVAKILPPLIGVVTIIVLWLVVSKMYGRAVAHLSAFAFAAGVVSVFFGAAGYLDRDGLSWLLVLMGVCSFYLMKGVHIRTAGLDFGWMARGACLLLFEACLYIEWGFLGPLILLLILVAYVLAEVMASMWPRLVSAFNSETDPLNLPLALVKQGCKGIVPSIRESSYAPLVLALTVSAIVAIFRPGYEPIYKAALTAFHPAEGTQYIGELRGIGPSDLVTWQFLLVPLVVGIFVTIRKRRPPDILWLSWFVVLFAGGLFARRFYNFAAPAFCVLCGIGLGAMLDLKGIRRSSLGEVATGVADSRTVLAYLRVMAAVLLIALTILGSALTSPYVGSFSRIMAVTPEWEEALTWMRAEENTPEDSKIITWWDYGYWVLDLAHRVPVVDNGWHPLNCDQDIARVYCATNDADAVEIMQKYRARYLVFSDIEIKILPVISWEGLEAAYGDKLSIPPELKDSLYARSLRGQTEFSGGLKRVYPASDIEKPPVVILALE
jgi:asparagine N-glycosylation enzyme membrane subunit Stt3